MAERFADPLRNDIVEYKREIKTVEKFIYSKPEMMEYSLPVASGESCYIDCNSDDICGSSADEF